MVCGLQISRLCLVIAPGQGWCEIIDLEIERRLRPHFKSYDGSYQQDLFSNLIYALHKKDQSDLEKLIHCIATDKILKRRKLFYKNSSNMRTNQKPCTTSACIFIDTLVRLSQVK